MKLKLIIHMKELQLEMKLLNMLNLQDMLIILSEKVQEFPKIQRFTA